MSYIEAYQIPLMSLVMTARLGLGYKHEHRAFRCTAVGLWVDLLYDFDRNLPGTTASRQPVLEV